jgi:hypothetical protein
MLVVRQAGTPNLPLRMAYVGAARAAMISNLEPVFGVLFAMTVVGERETPLQGTGIMSDLSWHWNCGARLSGTLARRSSS